MVEGVSEPSLRQVFSFWADGYDDALLGYPPLSRRYVGWPGWARVAYHEGHEVGRLEAASRETQTESVDG